MSATSAALAPAAPVAPRSFVQDLERTEIMRLQNSLQRNGRLGRINQRFPLISDDAEYIYAPSTIRADVRELRDGNASNVEDETTVTLRRGREMSIRTSLQSRNCGTRGQSARGQSGRYVAWFRCNSCSRSFKKNTLYLDETASGDLVDPKTVSPPEEQCNRCFRRASLLTELEWPFQFLGIAPFDPANTDHHAITKHDPRECPDCLKLGSWCNAARPLSRRQPKQYDQNMCAQCPSVSWSACARGLEAIVQVLGKTYRITLWPGLFVFPEGAQRLAREASAEAGLLIRNNAPEHIRDFADVLVALNFAARTRISGGDGGSGGGGRVTQLNDGPWFNRLVDAFIREREAPSVPGESVDGFLRFAPFPEDPALADWYVAYHGTNQANASKIFIDGVLSRPGTPGVRVAHGQAGSTTNQTIYVSPAKEMSAFPTYATIFPLKPTAMEERKKEEVSRFAQIIFEVRVRPGSYAIQQSTLAGRRHWPHDLRIDPRFATHQDLEWLLENSDDVALSAVLVRGFGKDTVDVFGELNERVTQNDRRPYIGHDAGPEFHWTFLRKEQEERLVHAQPSRVVPSPATTAMTAYVRNRAVVTASVAGHYLDNHGAVVTFRFESRTVAVSLGVVPRGSVPDVERLSDLLLSQQPGFCAAVIHASPPVWPRRGDNSDAEESKDNDGSEESKGDDAGPTGHEGVVSSDMFLGVEAGHAESVKTRGYMLRRRRHVPVSRTVDAAVTACQHWHPDDACRVFRVLPSPDIVSFQNPRGALRLATQHVPPQFLVQVA